MSETETGAVSAASGIDITELDATVPPQEDLYRHVNGKWEMRTPIPADKARYGSFHILAEHAEEAVRDIIVEGQEAEPGSEQRTVGDLFASFMDTDLIDTLGVAPIESQLAFAGNITTISSLLDTVARLERHGVGGFLDLFVDNDPGNPERYLVFAEQGGLGLPDESYYRDEKFASAREAYVNHIQRMFELTAEELPTTEGLDDAAARAGRVFELETALAAVHWDNVRTRDSVATYNPLAWAAVREMVAEGARSALEDDAAAGLNVSDHAADLDLWRTAMDAPAGALDTVVVREPSFLSGLGALLTPAHLESWKDWLAWNIIHSAAAFLPAASSRRTLTSTVAPSPEPLNSVLAGSAASPSWRVPWANPWARFMSAGTFPRPPKPTWMCWSITSLRLTANPLQTSNG